MGKCHPFMAQSKPDLIEAHQIERSTRVSSRLFPRLNLAQASIILQFLSDQEKHFRLVILNRAWHKALRAPLAWKRLPSQISQIHLFEAFSFLNQFQTLQNIDTPKLDSSLLRIFKEKIFRAQSIEVSQVTTHDQFNSIFQDTAIHKKLKTLQVDFTSEQDLFIPSLYDSIVEQQESYLTLFKQSQLAKLANLKQLKIQSKLLIHDRVLVWNFKKLVNLEFLHLQIQTPLRALRWNKIKVINLPQSLKILELPNMETLELQAQFLTSLKGLQQLQISHCNTSSIVRELPHGVMQLKITGITSQDLRFLAKIQNLSLLKVQDDIAISNLPKLTNLQVSPFYKTQISLKNLKNLRSLKIKAQLLNFPKGIGQHSCRIKSTGNSTFNIKGIEKYPNAYILSPIVKTTPDFNFESTFISNLNIHVKKASDLCLIKSKLIPHRVLTIKGIQALEETKAYEFEYLKVEKICLINDFIRESVQNPVQLAFKGNQLKEVEIYLPQSKLSLNILTKLLLLKIHCQEVQFKEDGAQISKLILKVNKITSQSASSSIYKSRAIYISLNYYFQFKFQRNFPMLAYLQIQDPTQNVLKGFLNKALKLKELQLEGRSQEKLSIKCPASLLILSILRFCWVGIMKLEHGPNTNLILRGEKQKEFINFMRQK